MDATPKQRELIQTYKDIQQAIIKQIRPGWKVSQITKIFTEELTAKGFGESWIPGPVHGVGLEFEELPHPEPLPKPYSAKCCRKLDSAHRALNFTH